MEGLRVEVTDFGILLKDRNNSWGNVLTSGEICGRMVVVRCGADRNHGADTA